jgi:hypothetical protein
MIPHCGHREEYKVRCTPALFFPLCFSGGIRVGASMGTTRFLLRFLNHEWLVQDLFRTGTMYPEPSSTLRIVTTRNTSARLAINIPRSFSSSKGDPLVARLTIPEDQF